MKNFEKLSPKYLRDMVFADEYIKEDLLDFANMEATNNIMLYGVYGTGKTSIAKAIARERIQKQGGNGEGAFFNVKSSEKHSLSKLIGSGRFQYFLCQIHPVIIIDEADRLKATEMDELCSYLDDHSVKTGGMVIFTTNYFEKIDGALLSRCSKYEIRCLAPDDALATAQRMLQLSNIFLEDDFVLKHLGYAVLPDSIGASWRDYGQAIDRLIRKNAPASDSKLARAGGSHLSVIK